jgi:cysteinyl-tRNA synthetase
MAEKHLGKVIDIHGGGSDLVFPHHENEIAQSCCAHGEHHFARYWLHNGFVQMESRKMSKSLGNVLTVHELLQQHPGEVLRYVLLSAHYHQPLDWSEAAVTRAHKTLDRLYAILRDHLLPVTAAEHAPAEVLEALYDDLNTPKALAAFNQLCRDLAMAKDPKEQARLGADVKAACALLGLLQDDPEAWFARQKQTLDADAIDALIAARDEARQQRDFARADAIREQLDGMNVIIEDSADGTKWRVRQ